ncbi:hypothetical protein [Paenibacillus alvei]|uniref:hypothetical protein n=1 Tax=Paenibacillus alvei TaxID=44250 RepID=UPI00158107E1|nr:hypothetical protein [Paenibacillus alvei]
MKTTMKLVIATLSGILMFGSMSFAVQADPSQTANDAAAATSTDQELTPEEQSKLVDKEVRRIGQEAKNPGDVYVAFFSNKKLMSGMEFLYIVNPLTFKTYEEYIKKAATYQGPVLQKPTNLPKGYKLVKAEIEYLKSKEFEAEVKKEAAIEGQGKLLYAKKYDWKVPGKFTLEYVNGKKKFLLDMLTIDPKTAKKQTGYVYEPPIEKVKKESPETAYSLLSWRVEDKEITIQTNTDMSKEDLIKLSKTMVLEKK